MGYNCLERKMKKYLFFALSVFLLTNCASEKSWHKGQAEWMRVQIHENFDYNKAFFNRIGLVV